MTDRSAANAGDRTSNSASSFLSPVSKYNKLREDELRAQQERLKSVRVDRTTPTLTGKRKLENGSSESAAIASANVRAASAVTFADAATTARSSSSTSSKAAALTASLAKKKRRTALSTNSTNSTSTSRSGASDSKSISGILKNYMKKVEAEKRSPMTTPPTTTIAAATKRHLTYGAMNQILSTPPARATTTSTTTSTSGRVQPTTDRTMQSPEMFSRAVDASVTRPTSSNATASTKTARPLKHFNSLAVTKSRRERQRDAAEAAATTSSAILPKRAPRLVTSVTDEAVVDLEHVADVASLETVEGSAILETLKSTGTPRKGRSFPSERAQPASDERDRAFLQRRHLALRKKYTAVPDTKVATDDGNWTYTESPHASGTIVIERKQPTATATARKLNVSEDAEDCVLDSTTRSAAVDPVDAATSQDDADASATEATAAGTSVVTSADESDKETTASKVARISAVKRTGWRVVALRFGAAAVLLSLAVAALPWLLSLSASALPFCDSDAAATNIFDYDRSHALQLYTRDATPTAATCRACPAFGTCANGSLVSCIVPFERVDSLCVDALDVRPALDHVAYEIRDFVVQYARANVATNSKLDDALISDVYAAVAPLIANNDALASLPREYVFSRALDLALRDLSDDIVVSAATDTTSSTSEDSALLLVSPTAASWLLEAKHRLIAHARVIAAVILVAALLARLVRIVTVRRMERELIDRLVKEVRFALLQRTARTDKTYPADYLRDDLFDLLPNVALDDRTWLRESVWPRVMAIVADDSRVRSSTQIVSGASMVVWEWIPVASPAKAPTTLASAKQALKTLAGGGSRRRTKASRKSFPM